MNSTTLIDPDTLLVLVAVAVSFLFGCVYRLVRGFGQQRWELASTGASLQALEERLEQQRAGLHGMQQEMGAHTRAPRAAPAPAASATRSRAKTDPMKLARTGADVEALMSRCKLSRAEAELVFSVHGTETGRAA